MHKSKISILLSSILALSLAACGSGGGSSGGGGGGDNNITVKTLATLSGTNTSYSPTCMYHSMQNQSWYLVKADGSGTGVQYFESTGTVSNVSGLPVIPTNSICQPNKYQLTWVNNSNATVVNAYDGYGNTSVFNLAGTGVAGSQVASSSFAFNYQNSYLVSNSSFSGNNLGFNQFNGTSPISYTALPMGIFANRANNVLYGFSSAIATGGADNVITQVVSADSGNNVPAAYFHYLVSTESVTDSTNFVASNGSAIPAMSALVDFVVSSSMPVTYVIQTGLVQPSFYFCNLTNAVGNVGTATCGNPVTSSLLLSQYKVMRLLSYDGTNLVFFGLNLATQTVGIFSITQN